MNTDIYSRKPIEFHSGIPVFSIRDEYIKCYEKISEDHLLEIAKLGRSSFMTKDQIEKNEEVTVKLIRKNLPAGSAILDAGVGLGHLIELLTDYECHGVDISIPYLIENKSRGLNVTMSKLEELPFINSCFDAVLACDVLEHVFRLDQSVEQILRVLKPSGLLFVRVPNEEVLDSYLENLQPYSHSHVRGFSLSSLRLYMEKCFGLKFIDSGYVGEVFSSFGQLRYKPPSRNIKLKSNIEELIGNNKLLKSDLGVSTILKFLNITYEEFGDAVLSLKGTSDEIYKMVLAELVNPVEVVAVFKKE